MWDRRGKGLRRSAGRPDDHESACTARPAAVGSGSGNGFSLVAAVTAAKWAVAAWFAAEITRLAMRIADEIHGLRRGKSLRKAEKVAAQSGD